MTTTSGKRTKPKRNPNARYEVWSGYPHPTDPGRYPMTEMRKFEWLTEAWKYAKNLPDDPAHAIVKIDRFSAARNWYSLEIRSRRNGIWCGPYQGSGAGRPLTGDEIADINDWKNQT